MRSDFSSDSRSSRLVILSVAGVSAETTLCQPTRRIFFKLSCQNVKVGKHLQLLSSRKLILRSLNVSHSCVPQGIICTSCRLMEARQCTLRSWTSCPVSECGQLVGWQAPPPSSRLPQVVGAFLFFHLFLLYCLFFLSAAVIGWRRWRADLRRPLLLSHSGSITLAQGLDAARS